jgi:hypothetical protein
MNKLYRLAVFVVFLALVAVLISQHLRTRFFEDLYLRQISLDADMVNSYGRVLNDTNLSQNLKLHRLDIINSTYATSIGAEMDLVFQAYGRKIPDVRKQLKANAGVSPEWRLDN